MQEFNMPFSDKNASIGISFDVPNKKETVVIGSPEDLKRYFTAGILSEKADLRTCKLGTLIDEMNVLAQADEDDKISKVIAAANGLCGVICRNIHVTRTLLTLWKLRTLYVSRKPKRFTESCSSGA